MNFPIFYLNEKKFKYKIKLLINLDKILNLRINITQHSLEQYQTDLHLEQRLDASLAHLAQANPSSKPFTMSQPYNSVKIFISYLAYSQLKVKKLIF